MRILISLPWVFILALVTAGQQTNDKLCPTIAVSGPGRVVKPGDVATFTASVNTRGLEISPGYKWTVSGGTIVSGQGTKTIEVRKTGWSGTASVEIFGLPFGCPNIESAADIVDPAPQATKLGDYRGPLDGASFGGVIEAAKREPNSELFVLVSGARRNTARSIQDKKDRLQTSLASGGIGPLRLTFVNLTTKTDRLTIWLVPPGATPPNPSF